MFRRLWSVARQVAHDERSSRTREIAVADDTPVDTLIDDLGLVADVTPVRNRTGWRRPELVLVSNVSPSRLDWLQCAAPDVELVPFERAEQALHAAPRADAIIGWHTPEIITRASQLRWIQVQTAGVENAIANPDIRARSILVTNLSRIAAPVIAEHVFALMLSASRRLRGFQALQQRRLWTPNRAGADEPGVLRGRTLVIVGLGGIGSAVARLADAFGMRTVAVRTRPGAPPGFAGTVVASSQLPAAVAHADFVVDSLPLTEETRGIFDSALFEAFKPGAMFVNVGRGETVVTDALASALQSGRIGAAALDVTDPEPLPRHHPLWRMPNVVITPHVAGEGGPSAQWRWQIMRENLRRYVNGERMLSVVDLARGY